MHLVETWFDPGAKNVSFWMLTEEIVNIVQERILENVSRRYRQEMEDFRNNGSFCCLCCNNVFHASDNHVPDDIEMFFYDNRDFSGDIEF